MYSHCVVYKTRVITSAVIVAVNESELLPLGIVVVVTLPAAACVVLVVSVTGATVVVVFCATAGCVLLLTTLVLIFSSNTSVSVPKLFRSLFIAA